MGKRVCDDLRAPQTVAALLGQTVRRHPERPAMRFTDPDGAHSLTWLEVGLLVVEAGRWLEDLGRPTRVTIVAPPSPSSWVLELAGLVAGCSINVVYDDAPIDELGRVMNIVRPAMIAVDASSEGRVRSAMAAVSLDAPLVDMDGLFPTWHNSTRAQALRRGVSGFEASSVVDALGAISMKGEQGRDTMLLIQSTGTTGPAKVIELPSRALLAATWAVRSTLAHRHPRFLALLPGGHISHQLIDVFVVTLLAGEVAFGGGLATLVPDLRATQPTVLFGSPLLYHEVKSEVRASLAGSRLGRLLGRRIDAAAASYREGGVIERGAAPLSGRLVGRRVARSLGLDRAQDLFSGTSPLDAETHCFFAAIGWYVRNTYGLSECGGAATISAPERMAVAELGQPVEGMVLRRDEDGQLLLHGPSLMAGFVDGPRVAPDGWLATGDLVAWKADNSLTFVGRRSAQVHAPGGATTLDALEAAVEAAHPGLRAVVNHRDSQNHRDPQNHRESVDHRDPVDHRGGGLALLVFPAAAGASAASQTPADLVGFLRSRPAAEGLGLIEAVGVGDCPLSVERGEIGPTGKVRRWRVGANWSHLLKPVNSAPGASAHPQATPGSQKRRPGYRDRRRRLSSSSARSRGSLVSNSARSRIEPSPDAPSPPVSSANNATTRRPNGWPGTAAQITDVGIERIHLGLRGDLGGR